MRIGGFATNPFGELLAETRRSSASQNCHMYLTTLRSEAGYRSADAKNFVVRVRCNDQCSSNGLKHDGGDLDRTQCPPRREFAWARRMGCSAVGYAAAVVVPSRK